MGASRRDDPLRLGRALLGHAGMLCTFTVAAEPGEVFAPYEELKRTHFRMADLCAEVGLRFTPCVLKAHGGGWNGAVRGLVEWMAGRTTAAQYTAGGRGIEDRATHQRIPSEGKRARDPSPPRPGRRRHTAQRLGGSGG